MVSGPTAPNMQETLALLHSESDALAGFLAGLDDEGWGRQSACDAWTVADAASHIAQGSQGSSVALVRARNDDPSPPEGARLLEAGDRASEPTAERAIAFSSGKAAPELLQAYREGADLLLRTASELQPEDWEKPSFHRRGIIPITRTSHAVSRKLLSTGGISGPPSTLPPRFPRPGPRKSPR